MCGDLRCSASRLPHWPAGSPPDGLAQLATAPFALHLLQQAIRLDPADGDLALRLFRANRDAGLLLLAGWAFIAIAI